MLLHRLAPASTIEKASIDEVYSECWLLAWWFLSEPCHNSQPACSGACLCGVFGAGTCSCYALLATCASGAALRVKVNAAACYPAVDVTSMVDQEVTQVGCVFLFCLTPCYRFSFYLCSHAWELCELA